MRMNRRSFIGSVFAVATAAVLPTAEPKTFYPAPDPSWKLVTLSYHDWLVDVYYDGRLQRRLETTSPGFVDTWRLWVKADSIEFLQPSIDHSPNGQFLMPLVNGIANSIASADRLPSLAEFRVDSFGRRI